MSPAGRQPLGFAATADEISMVAAHGISDQVIGTWDPRLVRTPRVLVPIAVDALTVGENGLLAADCTMRAPTAQDDTDDDGLVPAGTLLPPPFTDQAAPRAPGVYLHWALPDGLTKGEVGTDAAGAGTVSLPAVPDRWLIARIGPSTNPRRRSMTGWVLAAGGATPQVMPLDQWVEPRPATDVVAPLTALGHGDPAWAAYYDNVIGRLGFYDDLSDVTSGPVAYLVCGWYASSDPGRDPLGSGITSTSTFDAAMAAHGWSLADGELKESLRRRAGYLSATAALGLLQTSMAPRVTGPRVDDNGTYLTDGDWWPTGTLFHGAAVDLAWPVGPRTPTGVPTVDGLRVALGATPSEALGSLLAATDHDLGEERALEAFQLGALHELDEPDGPARIEAALHASAFGSLSGGPDETESIWVPPVPAQPDPPAAPGTPGPGIFQRRATHPVGGFSGFDTPTRLGSARVSVRLGQATPEEPAGSATVTGAATTTGRFGQVLDAVALNRLDRSDFVGPGTSPPTAPVTPTPGHYEDVRRAQPRFFHPTDPVLLVQGARRSFKHGGDDRYADDETLLCRLSGFTVHSVTVDLAGRVAARATVTGDQLLDRLTDNGSLPLDCDDLLRETVLLDPGSASAIEAVLAPTTTPSAALRQNVLVEQTVWWSLRDPRIDPAPIVARSGLSGTLPSPLAVTPAHQPWNPLHLDWEVEFTPAPGGISDFELGEVDLQPASGGQARGAAPGPIVVCGRCLVTANTADALADAAQHALEAATTSGGTTAAPPGTFERLPSALAGAATQNWRQFTVNVATAVAGAGGTGGGGDSGDTGGLSAAERAELAGLVEHLQDMDVLGGVLDGFHQHLRGGAPMIRPARADGTTAPAPIPMPEGFLPMRAGRLRISRARIVDGFGQYADLAPLLVPAEGDPQVVVGETLRVDAAPGTALLVPRFTSAARLQLRWIDAVDDVARTGANPVCGFVLPDHLDESLELFDASGRPLGQVRPDDADGLRWETAPGRAATVGRSPAVDVDNLFLRGLVLGLLDWGTADHRRLKDNGAPEPDDALSGLLRAIDSTLWTIDPFGHTGDEHLSMLVGHPIVVMRALLRLEVDDPVAPSANATTPVTVRLGNLAHWQDGLLGYFVEDDYTSFHAAAAAASMAREVGPGRGFLQQIQQVPGFAQHFGDDLPEGATTGDTPVTHPYIAPSDVITVRPDQDVRLTMLVEPHTVVHATTGLLPRKEIGMRREWMMPALASLAPTFRFGPVLIDPKQVRLPIATDIAGTWTWTHKADVATWVEEQVTNATQDARLSDDPAEGEEGWLRLTPPPPSPGATS